MALEVKDAIIKSEVNNNQVKFLVGPEDLEFTLDRTKLSKYVHSVDQFNNSNNHVDIDPSSFQVFADMVNGKGIAITSATIALQLVGLAEKIYSLKLHYACNEYMKSNYKGHQALIIYEYAKTDGLQELANSCLEYLKSNFGDVIQSSYFLKINVDIVADLYSRDNLKATNVQLIEALIKYANIQRTGDIRLHMKVAVDMIRFEDMEVEELLHMNGIEVLLTANDVLQKMKMIPMNPKKRKVDNDNLQIIEFALKKCKSKYVKKYFDYFHEEYVPNSTSISFSFSESLFLDFIHINDALTSYDVEKIELSINSIPITVRVGGNWIYIEKSVNKNEKIFLELYPTGDYRNQYTLSTNVTGVTVIKPERTFQNIGITHIGVKRDNLDAMLEINITK